MTDVRLLRLRAELYMAAQTLTGEDAEDFWALIDEIQSIRAHMAPVAPPSGNGDRRGHGGDP